MLGTHTEVRTRFIVDGTAGFPAIETSGAGDEIGYIERKKTFAVETARISLWQHKCLGGIPFRIDMTEIGSSVETVVATRTEYEPTRVSAPVVERFRIV